MIISRAPFRASFCGGLLLFYVPTTQAKINVRKALKELTGLPFELDQVGCSIVFIE
jgi:hypothetical protein